MSTLALLWLAYFILEIHLTSIFNYVSIFDLTSIFDLISIFKLTTIFDLAPLTSVLIYV